jgi:DNA invertase Pin-like site-specific DNA recombinase
MTRSLADFAKIIEVFDARGVSFVSVTQQFNTTSSTGRLTLNVLLSFAQFEREETGERIRDKIAASKRKGMWMGGRFRWVADDKHAGHPHRMRQRRDEWAPGWSSSGSLARSYQIWTRSAGAR